MCRNEAAIWSSGNVSPNPELIARQLYGLDGDWHTYRLEVQGTNIRLLIDGRLLLEASDSRHLSGGRVGVFAGYFDQINVRSFKVTAL
jgi:hypothetical protein